MEPTASPSILTEVRDFLSSLKMDWPELFTPAKRPKAEAPSPSLAVPQTPVPHKALPSILIPSVAVDAPLKAGLPEGDLAALFRSRAEYWAPYLGVTFNRVSVKDQRTLWGSCTREGNLNFSWRLALAPDAVLDYLIVHELSHRAQMNHSRRFWEVVETLCPGHRSHRRWLRKNGRALHEARR
ncbi:MAG: M48 family metallopeptidase [Elusimicrobia bacterium]|nr:M48 family metallopeptidase [Elusimicrobiota bacterium]